MPRKARIDAPGALHHIIVKGIERRRIFQEDWDRNHFLGRLGSVLMETKTPCYAWALMNNHIHLLLRSGNVPLATVMRNCLQDTEALETYPYCSHAVILGKREQVWQDADE